MFTGFFGAGNLGDEAILLAEVREFSLRCPGSTFAVASFDPDAHRARGLQAFPARDGDALGRAVAQADLLVVGGGGLWQDYWGWNPGDLFASEPYNIAFYARGPLVAAAVGVPVVMFANGIGPLHTREARRSVAAIASLASAVSVRDEDSAELLRRGGYLGALTLGADPAFALAPLAHAVEPRRRPVRIGVVPRMWSHGADANQILHAIGQAVGRLARRRSAEIVLLRFQRPGLGTADDDGTAIDRVVRTLPFGEGAIQVVDPSTPEEAAAWLGSCDAAVTMRLHGAILAGIAGTPSVAVAVDPKLTANAHRLGLTDLLVSLHACSPHRIEHALDAALDSRESLRSMIEAGVDAARRQLAGAFATALQSLGEGSMRMRRGVRVATRHATGARGLALRLPADTEAARRLVHTASGWPVSLIIAVGTAREPAILPENRSIPRVALMACPTDSFGDFLQTVAKGVREYAPASADVIVLDATRFDPQSARAALELARAENPEAGLIAVPGPADLDAPTTGAVYPDLGAAWIPRKLWDGAVAHLTGLDTASGCGAELARRARRALTPVVAVPLAPARAEDAAAIDRDLARARSFAPSRNRYHLPRPAVRLGDAITEWIAGRDVVVFPPTVGWSVPLVQRTNHMARAFAQAGHAVLYSVERIPADAGPLREVAPGILAVADPFSSLAFLDNPVVILYAYNIECASYFRRARTVYESIDDLSIFAGEPRLLHRLHRRAVARARVVTATAASLWREAAAIRPDTLYLPNAVWVADFDPRVAPEVSLPQKDLQWLESDRRPLLIYWGAVAPWFDDRLLADVARCRPDIRIAVIGPGHLRALPTLQAAAPDNLRYLGTRPYRALATYARRASAAVLPFRLGRITRATSPLKLFEYLAARLPVISTPLPESGPLEQVLLAGDVDSFRDAVDRALALRHDPAFHAWLDHTIPLHDWSTRAAAIRAALGIPGVEAPAPLAVPPELGRGDDPLPNAPLPEGDPHAELLRLELARLNKRLEALSARPDQAEAIAWLEREVARRAQQLRTREEELRTIRSSRTWRLAATYRRVRRRAAEFTYLVKSGRLSPLVGSTLKTAVKRLPYLRRLKRM